MNKITVVELCMSPDLGGLELSMISASKLLANDFNVLSVIKKESKISSYFEDSSNVVRLKKQSSFFMFGAAKKFANIIDSNNVKIIHFHWTKDIPFVILSKLLSKTKPKIIQTRHMTMTRFKNDFYHKFLYKNIDTILAVTLQVKEQLEKFIPKDVCPKVELLYAGVKEQELLDTKKIKLLKNELEMDASSFNIGMVGRINQAKGQYLLIEAVDILRKQGIKVNAYFVGHAMEVNYLEKLKADIEMKSLKDSIHFLGFMKNPHHFYQVCDAVVLASKQETFGLVLLEAIQMQTAVIGANSGGVLEIIENEENGLLFEAGDANDLAEKIKYMIKNPQNVEKMKVAALEKSKKIFNNKGQYEKLKNIFRSLL